MSTVSGVRGWLRAHPRLADLVPALLSVAVALSVHDPRDDIRQIPAVTGSGVAVVCVLLAGALLVVRREHPMPVWVGTVVLGATASGVVGGTAQAFFPCLVAVYTVATRCTFRTVTAVTVGTVAGAWLFTLAMRDGGAVEVLFALIAWVGAATAAGLAVRNQRAVVGAARQRAVDAERTADEHAQRRVAEERLRIARELHDVVAHHVAVITVQAGVARHLLPTDPAAATVALDHVRDASQLILQEIPALLGVLRTDEDDSPTAPAPRLAEVPELVEAARHAGLTVRSRQSGVPVALDAVTDLTAYRVVQEALTNAVKHGDGEAEVSLLYQADGVVVEVRNPLVEPAPPRVDPAVGGHGLIGMRERMAAIGGDLQVGPVDGVWIVRAALAGGRTTPADEVAHA